MELYYFMTGQAQPRKADRWFFIFIKTAVLGFMGLTFAVIAYFAW